MADKLKAVLSKLTDEKKTGKKAKVEEPVEEEIEEEIEDDDEEEEDEDDDEETVTSEPQEELSEEEIQRLKEIDQEISRLRDHGVFNAELLFQIIKINENLDRIASFMEKLGGEDAKKK